jgi:hypothetical protein
MSCGPGDASGWPWKQNAGLSVRARPCSVPSNRLTCVARKRGRQRLLVDRKAVVLAGDADAAAVQVLHRVVGTVVAELHLEGPGPRGQRQDLVPQADAEGRRAAGEQFAHGLDGVVAGLRVTGAVAEEDAVGPELEHLGRRRGGRHHGDAAAAAGQHAQDVALDAEVEGHHMVPGIGQRAVAAAQRPLGLGPVVGLGTR